VSDVISGGLLGHFGPLHLALGLYCLMAVFRWSFYQKLGHSPSLLILWMTCWGFIKLWSKVIKIFWPKI